MCLFTIPGAATGRAERSHDGDEFFEFIAGRFCGNRTFDVRRGHGFVC